MTELLKIDLPVTPDGNDPADYDAETLAQLNREIDAMHQEAKAPARVENQASHWRENTHTVTTEYLRQRPQPREVIGGYLPVCATSSVVAPGGVGKTTWLALKAIEIVHDDLHVAFVSAEDGEDDYQAKLHNLLEVNGEIDNRVAGKIHILNLKGRGLKLIEEAGGCYVPSATTHQLTSYLNACLPKVRVVVFETVSRFAGGEDNDRMEAVVSACDHIAMAINGASVLVHHTGKGQARDKVIDLYAGRGGSALGDNTRSMIVLTRLDQDYRGSQPTVIDSDDIAEGRAFEVTHVRNSYGRTQEPEYYVTRQGYCHGPTLERIPIATPDQLTKSRVEGIERRYNSAAAKVHEVIQAKGGRVKKNYFDSETKQLIGLNQKQGRALIVEMLDAGSLVEITELVGKAQAKFLTIGKVN